MPLLDLEDEVDRLYGAELGDFVPERKRIATALKAEGRKAEAARVLELRKPSVPAWAVNQIARRRRKELDELLDAGAKLEQAQAALLGGDRAGFADARQREQAVLKRLRQAAADVLGSRASHAMLDRIGATLASAAVTGAGREQLARGRLVEEVGPQGFEAFAGLAGPARPARPASKPAKDDGAPRRKEAVASARAALKAAREQAADVAAQRRRAERDVQSARKALDEAERAAARLEADQAAATEAVEDARRGLDAANDA